MPFSLPQLPLQFGDYLVWRSETFEDWVQHHLGYWKDRVIGAPAVRLPRCETTAPGSAGGVLGQFSFGAALTSGMQDLARRERTLLPLVVLTTYVAVTARWCGQDDLLVWFVSNARYHRELHTMIGRLARHLYLRVSVEARDTYSRLLKRVMKEFYSALEHEDFDRAFYFIDEKDLPQTDARFNWLPTYSARVPDDYGHAEKSEVQIRPFPFKRAGMADFALWFSQTQDTIEVTINYLPHVFPSSIVESFMNNLRTFAEAFARDSSTIIGEYDVPSSGS